jgi:cytochrome c peroxidase
MQYTKKLALGGALLMSQISFAHGPQPGSLIDFPVPPVPGLTDGASPIVTDENMAIALGKALFWDTNIGSDGMACGSCHFNAGVDSRFKNQLNPGNNTSRPTSQTFETTASGAAGGPNYTLTLSDFPLFEFIDPLDRASGLLFETDDVVASSGTFSGEFNTASRFVEAADDCNRSADLVFHVNNTGTRRVEPRNAPTVINAIFNHRNFWDGRANNVFNGSSNWGDRDPDAGVWVKTGRRTVVKQRLNLINSSLASLAVAPPQSDSEMACRNRNLADLGRKLLSRQPLQYQKVHDEDSVFGPMNLTVSTAGNLQPGLNTTYTQMIRQSFDKKYWSFSRRKFGGPATGGIPYSQMEANFSMFFGLALQMYQATLISDQAPIDLTPRETNPALPEYNTPTFEGMGYTLAEQESLVNGFHFYESEHCNTCHSGPALTTAAIASNSAVVTPTPGKFIGPNHSRIPYGPQVMGLDDFGNGAALHSIAAINQYNSLVSRTFSFGGPKLIDAGFMNTGVGHLDADPGLNNTDAFGNPLSFSDQYVQYLLDDPTGTGIVDQGINQVRACDFPNILTDNVNPNPGFLVFSAQDGLIADGSREGTPRTDNCRFPDSAYIPTPVAAAANLGGFKMAHASAAVFKIPSLRNIVLTGPYMHNGSMATLDQVLNFYTRFGNNDNTNRNTNMSMSTNPAVRTDMLFFIREAFTDPRIALKQAPFDHPEITIPNGHEGDHLFVTAGNALEATFAKDEFIIIPAVGANGLVNPIDEFADQLAP